MKETKKLALSAILCALSVAVMALSAVIDTLDLTLCALASLSMVVIYAEIGSPYTWCSWLLSSLLCFLFFPHSLAWAEYLLIFGVYPVLKGYIERLPRSLWLPAKLVYFNATISALLLLVRLILGVDFFADEDFALFRDYEVFGGVPLVTAVFFIVTNVTALVYDAFLRVMLRLYLLKYRAKVRRFLQ